MQYIKPKEYSFDLLAISNALEWPLSTPNYLKHKITKQHYVWQVKASIVSNADNNIANEYNVYLLIPYIYSLLL